MVLVNERQGLTQIRLIPNCSATWRQTRMVIFALGGLTLAIGIFWTLMGAWVILPFAGLEALLLAYLTYRVCLETYHQQVLYLYEEKFALEYGKDFPKKRWEFDRSTSEIEIRNPAHSLSPAEVVIRDQGEELQVGERLNSNDKQALIDCLKQAGLNYRVTGRTKTIALDGFDLS